MGALLMRWSSGTTKARNSGSPQRFGLASRLISVSSSGAVSSCYGFPGAPLQICQRLADRDGVVVSRPMRCANSRGPGPNSSLRSDSWNGPLKAGCGTRHFWVCARTRPLALYIGSDRHSRGCFVSPCESKIT